MAISIVVLNALFARSVYQRRGFALSVYQYRGLLLSIALLLLLSIILGHPFGRWLMCISLSEDARL